MNKFGFIGFGDLGKQINNHFIAKEQLPENQIYFFDDNLHKRGAKNAFRFHDYLLEEHKDLSFINCLGYKHLMLKNAIINQLLDAKRTIQGFNHPSCFISSDCTIMDGSIIYPLCAIDFGVVVGFGVLLNNSVTISHDCTIGSCTYLAPGVVISGKVTIGENCFVGAGSIITDHITIGSNVTIGVGTVVTKNIPDNTCVIGNPMKVVNQLVLR